MSAHGFYTVHKQNVEREPGKQFAVPGEVRTFGQDMHGNLAVWYVASSRQPTPRMYTLAFTGGSAWSTDYISAHLANRLIATHVDADGIVWHILENAA